MSMENHKDVDISVVSDDWRMQEHIPLAAPSWDHNSSMEWTATHTLDKGYGSLPQQKGQNERKKTFNGIFSIFNKKEELSSVASQSSGKGSSAPIHALFNLCKVFIGIGVLTGPYAMSHWGIILGIFGVSFAGLMSLYSINIQAQTRHRLENMINNPDVSNRFGEGNSNEVSRNMYQNEMDESVISEINPIRIRINNYSELGRAAFGRAGFLFVGVCLFLQQMCSVTAYFSFIHNYIPISLALCIIIPFWLFWNIKKISYLSLFSLWAIISALVLVMYHSVEHIDAVPKTDLKYFDLINFPYFFGVSIFIFEGNWASLQIETSMKEPKKFEGVSIIGILFVIVLNWIVSTLAYTSYVGTVKDVVLFNLPPNFVSTLVRLSYSLGLIFSIPIQISPMVDIMYRSEMLDNYLRPFRETPKIKYYISVLFILMACVLFALYIPWLQMFINFSGSLVGVFTLSIIPTLCYNKAFKEEITWARWMVHLIMMTIMSIAGVISIYYSYMFMVHGKD